jgi:hypothetical protein
MFLKQQNGHKKCKFYKSCLFLGVVNEVNMTELGKNVGFSGQCFPVRSLTRNNALESGYAGRCTEVLNYARSL